MVRFNIPTEEPVRSISITQFAGANLNPDVSQIGDNESPDLLNITLDTDGTPDKRTGYIRAFDSLGVGNVNGLFSFGGKMLIANGTKVYRWDYTTVPVELYSPITNAKMNGFEFGGKLYLINGYEYLVYDGTTVSPSTPYIPTLTISTSPAGGGTPLDQWNLLGRGFKQLFNGDGTAKAYQLALKGLDADALVVKVGGVTKTLTTDYTVDRVNGIVTFVAAPATGVNNVEITAYKEVGKRTKILGCTRWNIYGGSNDTRVHLFGNTSDPSTVYRCGVSDPTYFPENDFNTFDGTVTAKVNQYDTSVVMTDKGLWLETFELSGGVPSFPTRPLNSAVGCVAPGSVQLVDNNPVFLSDNGAMMLSSSQVRSERNVQLISQKINADLLKRGKDCVSIDHDDCYFLAFADGTVWVWHYRLDAWVVWNNVKATCFLVADGTLYFGSENGMVYRFKKPTDVRPYNDDDAKITAYWSSKVFAFGAEDYYKLVKTLHTTMRTGDSVGATVSYRSDRNSQWTEWVALVTHDTTLFNYSLLNYATWTYTSSILPQAMAKKINAKKVVYFQLRFDNDVIDQSMGLLALGLHFSVQKAVK